MAIKDAEAAQKSRKSSFPTAGLRIVSKIGRTKPLKSVYLYVSTSMYWKEASQFGRNLPQTILDFQGSNSIDYVRLKDGATWDDVEKAVQPGECDGKPSVTVPGVLWNPNPDNKPLLSRSVTIQLVVDNVKLRDEWLEQFRACVAPWELIRQQMMGLKNHMSSNEISELRKKIDNLLGSLGGM